MKAIRTLIFALTLIILSSNSFAQNELGLTKEEILKLNWVKEYHQKRPYNPNLETTLRVTTNEYHITFAFSILDICISQTMESRSYMGDIKLRDYLSLKGAPLSSSTYTLNIKGKKAYAAIVATHNDLPHQVCFSYEQIFVTNLTPRKDTYPYEVN